MIINLVSPMDTSSVSSADSLDIYLLYVELILPCRKATYEPDPVDVLIEHIINTYSYIVPKCQITVDVPKTSDCLLLTLTVSNNLHTYTKRFDIQSNIESVRLDAMENAKKFLQWISLHPLYYTVTRIPINFEKCLNFKVNRYNGIVQSLTYIDNHQTIDVDYNSTRVDLSTIYQIQKLLDKLPLDSQPWFSPGDKGAAENALSAHLPGTYCLRSSSVPQAYALNYRESQTKYFSSLLEKRDFGYFSGNTTKDIIADSSDLSGKRVVSVRSIKGLYCSSPFYLMAYWKSYGLEAHRINHKWFLLNDPETNYLSNCIQTTQQFIDSKLPVMIQKDFKVEKLKYHLGDNFRFVALSVDLLNVTLDIEEQLQLKKMITEYIYENIEGSCDVRIGTNPKLQLIFDWFIDV